MPAADRDMTPLMRAVVTNRRGEPGGIYRGFYVQRGNVTERLIGELQTRSAGAVSSGPRRLSEN